MTSELSEILDKALDEQLSWDAQADNGDNGFEPWEDADAIELMVAAAAMVQATPVMPLPDQVQRAADKETFLMQMELLPAAEVSPVAPAGLFAWLSQRLSLPSFQQTHKEPRPMLPLLVKAALVITVLISSLGGTAVLSAAALPGSPGYPVKLLLEEARLSMTDNPANQAALHLAFAGERAQEMAGLAGQNRATTQTHLANYQEHWREALQHAGELRDNNMQAMMVQAQTMAGEQEALLEQAQIRAGSQVRTRLQEATQSLVQVQTAVALGIQNQNTYRSRIQALPEDWPGKGAGPGFFPQDCQHDCDESAGFAPGPDFGPGDGAAPFGPGDGECSDCPTDGEGPFGPGDGECSDCPKDGDGPIDPNGPRDGAGQHGPGDGECSDDPNGPGDGDCQDDSRAHNGPEHEDDPDDSEDDDFPGHEDGPGHEDDDHGNDDSGNDDSGDDDSGNDDSGNDDSGNDDSGNDDENDDSGNDDSGNDDSGNDDFGNDDSGNDDDGNDDSGNDDSGNDDSGNDDSGNDDSGNDDDGNDDPGNDDDGNDDPGNDDSGNDDPGEEDEDRGKNKKKGD